MIVDTIQLENRKVLLLQKYRVSDSFADIINITATAVLGYGDYEYKLDNGYIRCSDFINGIDSLL
jgi:hypothetical protein